jgi:hypothetical protein
MKFERRYEMSQSNPPILLKQQVYTEIVSVWRMNGELIEITQNSDGKYLMYKLTENEFKKWDYYSHRDITKSCGWYRKKVYPPVK